MMDDKTYRKLVDEAFNMVDAAFEDADPDLAESVLSQGTVTIVYQGKLRFIISPQPPVRQIWAAFKDRAWHFDHDAATGRWLDDRGRGIELFKLVEELTRDNAKLDVTVGR